MSVVTMTEELSLATSFFELPHHRVVRFLAWPLMESYIEKHAGRGSVFKLSLVGIAGGDSTSGGVGLDAVYREKAREMIVSLYLSLFSGNDDDATGIKCATVNGTSFALFVSCGVPPPKKKLPKRSPRKKGKPVATDTSIFALKDKLGKPPSLQCIAALTVTTGEKYQFAHWLGVTEARSPKSRYTSWRRRGLASLLLNFVVKRAALPSVSGPQTILLQCTLPKPPLPPAEFDETKPKQDDSPVCFYLKLGGIIPSHAADNGWSTVLQDAVVATTITTFPILWVNAKDHDMLLVTLFAGRLPVPSMPKHVRKASSTPKDLRYAWFPFDGADPLEVLDLHDDDLFIFRDCSSMGTDQDFGTNYHPYHSGDSLGGSIDIAWRKAYDVEKPNTQRFHADAMNMMLAWVFRNHLQFQRRVFVIAPEIANEIQLLFQQYMDLLEMDPASSERVNALSTLNSCLVGGNESVAGYVMNHLDMFTIPCIVFVCEEGIGRWTFTVAMNAGAAVNAPFAPRDVVSGYHYVDAIGPADANGSEPLPPENGFRWFLNIAWMLINDSNHTGLATLPSFECPLQVNAFGSTGDVPGFNRLVFKAPSIFVQPGSMANAGLGCILNLSRLIHIWPRCDWSPNHRGLVIQKEAGLVVMDPRTFGLTEEWDVCDPKYAIQGLRREYEVFIDRLSTLAHKKAPKPKITKIKRVIALLPTPVFTMRNQLYKGIAGVGAFKNVVAMAADDVSGDPTNDSPPDDAYEEPAATGMDDGNDGEPTKDNTDGGSEDKTTQGSAGDDAKEGDTGGGNADKPAQGNAGDGNDKEGDTGDGNDDKPTQGSAADGDDGKPNKDDTGDDDAEGKPATDNEADG